MKRHKTLTLTTELHGRQMLEAGFEPATKGLLEFLAVLTLLLVHKCIFRSNIISVLARSRMGTLNKHQHDSKRKLLANTTQSNTIITS